MSIGAELETEPVSSIFSTRKSESEIVNCSINRVKSQESQDVCGGRKGSTHYLNYIYGELYPRDRKSAWAWFRKHSC